MKSNKKGMTLVECIIAMAVFAVATTGFTMAATACMRAQAKSSNRMSKTNVQTTNLEHFSTFSRVLDPEYSNVRPMTSGTNQFDIVFPFKASEVVNQNVYGYYAKLDNADSDQVYDLSFFSAADQIKLAEGEYWVTLYNYSDKQMSFSITCDTGCEFFDNEGNSSNQTSLPTHMWAPGGGYMKFGVRNISGGTGATINIQGEVDDDNNNNNNIVEETISINKDWMPNGTLDNGGNGDNMVKVYYYHGFENFTQFEDDHPELEN